MAAEGFVSDTDKGAVIGIKAVPSSSRNGFGEISGGFLKVKVAAPPVEGEANAELVSFLGKSFRMPKSDITILKGASGRTKMVLLAGRKAAEITALVAGKIREKK